MKMMTTPAVVSAAAPLPLASDSSSAVISVARRLLPHLEQGRRVDAAVLRDGQRANPRSLNCLNCRF